MPPSHVLAVVDGGAGVTHTMVLLFLVKEALIVILEEPTKGMRVEALKYEAYRYNGKMSIPMIQLLSAADLFKKPLPLILPAKNMVIDRKKGDPVTVVQKEELPP